MKKGWTYGKIPPLLTEGYIYTLCYPWTLPGKMLVGWGQDNVRELLAIKRAGLQTPLLALQPSGSTLPLPPASLDAADLYLHHKVLPFACRLSRLLPMPRADGLILTALHVMFHH